jgi:hypothetical protein
MATRSSTTASHPDWAVDWHSLDRSSGRQIDFSKFAKDAQGYATVYGGTALAEDATTHLLIPRDGTHPATGLLEGDAYEGDRDAALSGYGLIVGGNVYYNLTPNAAADRAALLTELRASGTGWAFEDYLDSTS